LNGLVNGSGPPADAAYQEFRSREVAAGRDVLWDVVAGIGGDAGWYAADAAWRARALLDRLIGGPGMRGRDAELRPGAELDFWRVVEVVPPRRLLLRAEMRMPGTPWLELTVTAVDPSRSILGQRVWFAPSNLLGHVQWWAELAGHKLVFSRMLDGIAREAERRVA
jgi:hypothetical protein